MSVVEYVKSQEEPVRRWFEETLGYQLPEVNYVKVPEDMPLGYRQLVVMSLLDSDWRNRLQTMKSRNQPLKEIERLGLDHKPGTIFIYPSFYSRWKNWDEGTQVHLSHELFHLAQESEGLLRGRPLGNEGIACYTEIGYTFTSEQIADPENFSPRHGINESGINEEDLTEETKEKLERWHEKAEHGRLATDHVMRSKAGKSLKVENIEVLTIHDIFENIGPYLLTRKLHERVKDETKKRMRHGLF